MASSRCCAVLRGSGYYVDVGASQLIIDGQVQLRSGEDSKIIGSTVVLNDGTELEADQNIKSASDLQLQ